MTALQAPANDARASEWGRFAVSIPGWRWMPGMRWLLPTDAPQPQAGRVYDETQAAWWNDPRTDVDGDSVPDPDDPATAGCLLEMLCADGRPVAVIRMSPLLCVTVYRNDLGMHTAPTLGRACIRAAALGRWPGGEG